MAEQEVAKHTKKIYKVWNSKEHSFWHKLKEFLLEIFIIVFAITVSLWFHNRSEHQHEQENVKDFLTGLKEDLKKDIGEMGEDKKSYESQRAVYRYIANTKPGDSLSKDTLNFYYTWILNTTGLNPNSGRFEGFKSSGKIGTIENKELQNDIMDLYQENIPALLASTNNYVSNKSRLFDYLQKNVKRLTDSTTNFAFVLNTDEAHNICQVLSFTGEINSRYDETIAKMKKIIAAIDAGYELKE